MWLLRGQFRGMLHFTCAPLGIGAISVPCCRFRRSYLSFYALQFMLQPAQKCVAAGGLATTSGSSGMQVSSAHFFCLSLFLICWPCAIKQIKSALHAIVYVAGSTCGKNSSVLSALHNSFSYCSVQHDSAGRIQVVPAASSHAMVSHS